MTEMLKQVQHDVPGNLQLILNTSPSAKPTKWCLRQIPSEELVSGSNVTICHWHLWEKSAVVCRFLIFVPQILPSESLRGKWQHWTIYVWH